MSVWIIAGCLNAQCSPCAFIAFGYFCYQIEQSISQFCYHTRKNLRPRRVTKIPCLGNKMPLSCLQKRCLTAPKRCLKTAQKPSENLRNAPQTNKNTSKMFNQSSSRHKALTSNLNHKALSFLTISILAPSLITSRPP